MVNNGEEPWRRLKTVDTTLKIIESLAEGRSAGVSEIASQLELSKSSIHSHLTTLTEAGYLLQEDGEYSLSSQFLTIGESVRADNPLFQYGRAKADGLARETGHYAHLYTEEGGHGVNTYEARGSQAEDYEYQSLKLQKFEQMHMTASGKAVLANLPKVQVSEIIDNHELTAYTAQTITDKSELLDELNEIQEKGFAVNNEEEIRGFRAVAAPVEIKTGEVLGSISAAGPKSHLNGTLFEERLPEKVKNAANKIEVEINMAKQGLVDNRI